MGCRVRQFFSWLLLLGAIVLGVLLISEILNPPDAVAAVRQVEEAPGQVVYQSRQSLKDQHGNAWQAVAFKRIRPNGSTSFELRLVGFPGVVEIDHSQPLTITDPSGTTLTATDVSSTIFPVTASPTSNVGQYDLQPLLSDLHEAFLKLSLPTIQGGINLSVPPWLVEEWKSVAEQG